MKERIFSLLDVPEAILAYYVRAQAEHCVRDFRKSCSIAEAAFALLLLRWASKDQGLAQGFDNNTENLFNDTILIRDALFFQAAVLSSDLDVKRMSAYCLLSVLTPNS